MNMRRIALGIVLITFGGLAAACMPDGQPVGNPSAETRVLPKKAPSPMPVPSARAASTALPPRTVIELAILHTNDSQGFVDPCG